MNIDDKILQQFEGGLNPQSPEDSSIKAEVKGYGEISSIFSIEGIPGWIFKRLPLFDTEAEAEKYSAGYHHYVKEMQASGLRLPKDDTRIIKGDRVVLYVAQEQFDPQQFCHNLLHTLTSAESQEMMAGLFNKLKRYGHSTRKNCRHWN